MNLRNFKAPDMRQAMILVREQHGAEAVIVSSKTVPGGGVEVMSAIDFDPDMYAALNPKAQKSDATAKIPTPATDAPLDVKELPEGMRRALAVSRGGYGAAIPAAAGKVKLGVVLAKVVDATAAGVRKLTARAPSFASIMPAATATPAAAPALHVAAGLDTLSPAVAQMHSELGSMRQMIERELGQMSSDRLRATRGRAMGMDLLRDFGCEARFVNTLVAQLDEDLAEADVVDAVIQQLTSAVRTPEVDPLEEGGVIALVGPTGAGKTTTAAKLAARFARKHSARDVALITTDQHRAAAREQLQAHGRRLGITVIEADGPAALPTVLSQIAEYPLVIIDTAGLSPRDKALISDLNMIRQAGRVGTLLVLPANGNAHDLADLVRTYGVARPDGVVLTKVDETTRLGGALSICKANDLPIAFTTNGQAVPDDISTADGSELAGRLKDMVSSIAAQDEARHVAA